MNKSHFKILYNWLALERKSKSKGNTSLCNSTGISVFNYLCKIVSGEMASLKCRGPQDFFSLLGWHSFYLACFCCKVGKVEKTQNKMKQKNKLV